MNHDESIAILLDAVTEEPQGDRPAPDQRRQAEEHVSRCSDCWRALSLLHERATGERPPHADRMRELFGCERVQDEMYLLVGLTGPQIAANRPDVARHLAWCHACCGRFAEVLEVEEAAARGELGPSISLASRSRWREVTGALGETLRELVGQVVVQVREGVAAFAVAPEGLFVSPALAPAARRGAPTASEPTLGPLLGSRARLTLEDSGLVAEVVLHGHGEDRVGLELTVSGAADAPLSVSLRTVTGADRTELVAAQTVRAGKPVIFGGLVPGRYVLDIQEKRRDLHFRLGFDIARPSATSG
ncbi:MAG: hypothetical protein E6J79_18250 [Deltaproteobacteria bacterium]|nr:MAG: hypothetical protein E6J79_18250 [Deltaproteobacteria bacterium]